MTSNTEILAMPRFSQPEGWRWHSFKSASRRTIRFGSVFPKTRIPDAVVICLPGFREFGEKYFELAHDMLERNFAFWVLDWAGQGGSDRLLPKSPLKVHSHGFDQNIADLRKFIFDYVKPASVHPDVGRLPVILTGHSMGAHIGLRYLHDNPEDFIRAAVFSAPLIRIRQFAAYPALLSRLLCGPFCVYPRGYIPGGEKMAELARQMPPGEGLYSSDPERDRIHRAWFEASPSLQVRGPTYRWLYETVKSCAILQKPSYLRKIETPVLLGLAGKDFIVSSGATRKIASLLPNAQLVELTDARHEIFMERDEIRNQFMAASDDFIRHRVPSRQDRLKKF